MARKVTVYNTQTSTSQTIETNATTFGELRSQLGWDEGCSSGQTIVEGQSGATFTSDQQMLPSDIETAGGTTNDLMLYVTPSRKIRSGKNA